MDIMALSTAMSQQNLAVQVGMAVNKMALDTIEQTGGNTVQMIKQMEQSICPNLGKNIDIRL